MGIEKINLGQQPDDSTGDTIREGGRKVNALIDYVLSSGLKPFVAGELLSSDKAPFHRVYQGNLYRYVGAVPNTLKASDIPGDSVVWVKVSDWYAEKKVLEAHQNNSSIHVTQQQKEDWGERYSLIPISGTKKFQLLKGEQVISEIDMTPYFEQIIASILSDKEALQAHINDQGVHFTAQEKQDLESRLEGKVSYLKAENLTDEQKRVAQYNMGLLNHKHPYLELLGGVLTGRTEMAVNYHTVMFGNEKTLVHKEYLEKWSKGQFLKKEDYLGVQVIQYWNQVTSFSLNRNRPGAKVGTILVNETKKELYVKMSDQEWHSVQTSKI